MYNCMIVWYSDVAWCYNMIRDSDIGVLSVIIVVVCIDVWCSDRSMGSDKTGHDL